MIGRDKVIICVIITIVISAILFGILMAYRNYTLPMPVYNINDTIIFVKSMSKYILFYCILIFIFVWLR